MLVMMRVGQTHAEADAKMPGAHTDIMTARGYERLREGGVEIRDRQWDVIYCGRSEAAICAARLFREDVIITHALDERRGGAIEGRLWEEIRQELPPKRYKLWERDYFRCPPGGESYQDLEDRIQTWARSTLWPALDRNQSVLVVRHETPLKVLMGLLRGAEPDEIIESRVEAAMPYFWNGKRPDPKG